MVQGAKRIEDGQESDQAVRHKLAVHAASTLGRDRCAADSNNLVVAVTSVERLAATDWAITTTRDRGFAVSLESLKKQLEHIVRFFDENRDAYCHGRGQGGQVETAGYALLALELGDWKPDATTEAVVEYPLQYNQDLDHWRTTSQRPPSEASDFTSSYLAIRAHR